MTQHSSVDDELDAIFNKAAGDKAFYLRGEVEPKIKALIEVEQVKARRFELLSWLPVAKLWSDEGMPGPLHQLSERIAELEAQLKERSE